MYYLFPFGNVPQSEEIIIYGAGEIGQSFLKQLKITKLYSTIYMTDRKMVSSSIVRNIVYLPVEEAIELSAIPIVVASIKFGDEIKQHLLSQGIDGDRVVTVDTNHVLEENQFEPHTFDWNEYYSNAEGHNEVQFQTYLEPLLRTYSFDFSQVLDFACGKGRIAELVGEHSKSLTCVDTSHEAIVHCIQRFQDKAHVECRVSEPENIPVANQSMSFIYSWDAMVHFDYRSVDYIMSEFTRILKSGGYAVIHHSNARDHNTFEADRNWRKNPHCRSEFNAKDMLHIATKSGFVVEQQQIIDWGIKGLDCISVLRKR